MKLNKYLIILALETLLEQVKDAEDYKQVNVLKDEIKKVKELQI